MSAKKNIIISVIANTDQFTKQMDRLSRQMTAIGKKLEDTGRKMTMRFTAPIVALGALSVKAFAEQEAAIGKLNAALAANGKDVERVSKEYQDFASELQKTTVVGDETTIALLQLAETMGATDSKEAVKGAVALSRALKVDLQSATKMTVLAQQGQYQMLQRYVPALKAANSDTEKAAIVQKLFADGMKIAEAEAETTSGRLMQLKNAVGDLSESFGAILAKHITPLAKRLTELVQRLQDMDDATRKNVVRWAGLLAALGPVKWIMGIIIGRIVPSMIKGLTTLRMVLGLVTGATVKLNAAMKANIVSLAVTAIAAAVMLLRSKTKELSQAQQELIDIQKQATVEEQKQISTLDALFDALKKTTHGSEDRLKIIRLLKDEHGVTIDNYRDTVKWEAELKRAYSEGTTALKNRITLQVYSSKLAVLEAERQNLAEKVLEQDRQIRIANELERTGRADKHVRTMRRNAISRLVEYNRELQMTSREIDQLAEKSVGLSIKMGAIFEEPDPVSKHREKINDATEAYSKYIGEIVATRTATLDLSKSTESLSQKIELMPQRGDALTNYLDKLRNKANMVRDAMEELAAQLESLIEGQIVAFGEALGKALTGSEDAFSDWKSNFVMALADFGKEFGSYLIGLGVAIEAFDKSLKSGQGYIAIVAGVALVAVAAALKNHMNKGVEGYALGTSFAPGGMALVGERGEELVNLPRGSQVIPNMRLNSMMGDMSPVVTIRGNDLQLLFDRNNKRQRRYR